jgi:L-ascorbate metabolism protein UlaG (beta-lactamase superfamily)
MHGLGRTLMKFIAICGEHDSISRVHIPGENKQTHGGIVNCYVMLARIPGRFVMSPNAGLLGRFAVAAVATLVVHSNSGSARAAEAKSTAIQVTSLGHATFLVESGGGTRIMIDPWLRQNPVTPAELKDPTRYRLHAVLVTHSHFDHAADAVELAKSANAPLISAFEWVSAQALPDTLKMGGNVGGAFRIGDVTVHLVPAMHSSEPSGRALGFVLTFADGRSLYHTGDTWIFGDMALIQELYHPNIILIAVGGGPYGEDPATAYLAIEKYFKPDVIVPMHYGTFPALSQQREVDAAFGKDKRVTYMKPGDMKDF